MSFGMHQANGAKANLLSSPEASVVVTTTSSDASSMSSNPKDNDDLVEKPRGFFADQFEVRPMLLLDWS